jgi:hypothetical protein
MVSIASGLDRLQLAGMLADLAPYSSDHPDWQEFVKVASAAAVSGAELWSAPFLDTNR